MSDKTQFELRIVAYREEGAWLAHCLELDIVAEGKSSKEAVRDLIDLCILQVKVAIEEMISPRSFDRRRPRFGRCFFPRRRRNASSRRPTAP